MAAAAIRGRIARRETERQDAGARSASFRSPPRRSLGEIAHWTGATLGRRRRPRADRPGRRGARRSRPGRSDLPRQSALSRRSFQVDPRRRRVRRRRAMPREAPAGLRPARDAAALSGDGRDDGAALPAGRAAALGVRRDAASRRPRFVHPAARLEPGVVVDPGAVIGPGAEIGAGTLIGANAVIGPDVRIGRDCVDRRRARRSSAR